MGFGVQTGGYQRTAAVGGAEVITAARTLTASENGKTFFLDNATGFATTLPAPLLNLRFTFVIKTAVTSTNMTVVATSTLIKGQILSCDLNAAADADFGTAGELTIAFVANKTVAGDWVEVNCDGTNWHMTGGCSVFDAITLS